MSDPAPHPGTKSSTPDSIDLVTQTRSLRRKVIFWRRMAWLLLGGLGIVSVILWQRGEQHRRDCRNALVYYYQRATDLKLGTQPLPLLEGDWQSIKAPPDLLSPFHYNLIALNWQTQPAEGERLALAVCREPHVLGFSRGRHVLFDDGKIEWFSESNARDMVRQAERDDGR